MLKSRDKFRNHGDGFPLVVSSNLMRLLHRLATLHLPCRQNNDNSMNIAKNLFFLK